MAKAVTASGKRDGSIRLIEGGSEKDGWVGMSLFGLCSWGPTRQSAWDSLCAEMARYAATPGAR